MVKRKAPAPRKVCVIDRRTRSWTLAEASSSGTQRLSSDVSPIVCDEDSCSRALLTNSDVEVQGRDCPTADISRVAGKKRRIKKSPLNGDLQKLVDACDFFLRIRGDSSGAPVDSVGLLGTLEFLLEGELNVLPLMQQYGCWLYVAQVPDRSFVYYEWDHVDVTCPNCSSLTLQQNGTLHAIYALIRSDELPDYELLIALIPKKFALQLKAVDSGDGKFKLNVYLLEPALAKLNNRSFLTFDSRHGKKVVTAIRHFLGIPPPQMSGEPRIPSDGNCDIDEMYEAVKRYHTRETRELVDVQHPSLVPTLRPYQVDAVRWMLTREHQHRWQDSSANRNDLPVHPLFVDVKLDKDGPTLYFNQHGGILTRDRPAFNDYLPSGILADEMGLGKTVEVIAGILCNPRPREVSRKPGNSNGTITATTDASSSDAIVKRKPFFECICGVTPSNDADSSEVNDDVVQCQNCGTWQHADCIKYDSTDAVVGVDYRCPHCWMLMPRIPSRATLIVSPAAIRDQWMDELRKHVDRESLKILIYEGVYGSGYIQPRALADHDMVIMTYLTMRKEIDYVDLPHSNSDRGRRFRHPKRYMAVPSPLVAVEWWRVCLDEAQMVESCMAKTAAMALRLSAVHRWCVTGTPIQKSVDDLYGLVLFLGLDPYGVRYWWKECLADPYFRGDVEPLHAVISKVMWRSCKADVLEQLDLPSQTEAVHWLSFTPVEEHFYRRQHLECSVAVDATTTSCRTLDARLDSFDRHVVDKWLHLLLRLRQACCHPQVVRGRFVAMRKTTMTMEDLLGALIEKAKIECVEQHRQHIAALNGLAAIHIIKEEWCEAVEKYREVLQSARELRPRIKTDKLPLLHALNNLIEVLEGSHEGVSPTTGDSDLRRDADELRSKYLEKCFNKVRDSRDVLTQATDAVEHVSTWIAGKTPWWVDVLGSLAYTKHDADVVDRVKQEIANTGTSNGDAIDYSSSFRNCRGLMYVVKRRCDKLREYRSALSKAVLALDDRPPAEVIDRAVECHLRRAPATASSKGPNQKFHRCVYCDVQDLFNLYESELFSFEKEETIAVGLTDEDARLGPLRRGTWAGGVAEQMLRGILSFARVHEKIPRQWIESGQTQMRHLEALKKEFKALRGAWMQSMDQVSALDELAMANTRLRVRLAGEPQSDPPRLNILEPGEVDYHRLKANSERIAAKHELSKNLGQLAYVQNLANSDYGKRGGSNPDQCPICRQVLGEQWCVLQCGHCFCAECIRVLTIRRHQCGGGRQSGSLKCAVCRHVTALGEVSHVSTKIDISERRDINVVGSHSTKVEAVVRKLLQIRADEPDSKTLVFSTWPEVLDLLARALKQNAVTFRNLSNSKSFQINLTEFKVDPKVSTLLLPVHTGSNGLNLIEATHVILFEPILNPAHEVQAISRVHRIGQTKPTVVHRFLVRNTIEEQMHSVLGAKAHRKDDNEKLNSATDDHPLTVRDLLDLFRDNPAVFDQ